MPHMIFVYGTLKNGWGNHRIIEDQKFIGWAESLQLKWQMYSLGGFPGILSGDKRITGELYEVDDEAFARCDRLEGHPTFYKREQHKFIDLEGFIHTAWVYIYQGKCMPGTEIDVW